jgi:hypothetical protein
LNTLNKKKFNDSKPIKNVVDECKVYNYWIYIFKSEIIRRLEKIGYDKNLTRKKLIECLK